MTSCEFCGSEILWGNELYKDGKIACPKCSGATVMAPILPIGPGGRWVTLTRTRRGTNRRVPLRGSLPTVRHEERNPIEANYRKAREITYKMPAPILGVFAPDEMHEIEKLREEFVNTYRHAWGSNEGLSTTRINEMSKRDLESSIRSLKRMIEANEGRQ